MFANLYVVFESQTFILDISSISIWIYGLDAVETPHTPMFA